MKARKILYSPGYGCEWIPYQSQPKEFRLYMLTYQPIIDYLEFGGKAEDLIAKGFFSKEDDHLLIKQLKKECLGKFGIDYVCVLGAKNLCVATVIGRIWIEIYDGFESIVTEEEQEERWL